MIKRKLSICFRKYVKSRVNVKLNRKKLAKKIIQGKFPKLCDCAPKIGMRDEVIGVKESPSKVMKGIFRYKTRKLLLFW